MKFVRFIAGGEESWGIAEGGRAIRITGNPLEGWEKTDQSFSLDEIKYLPPCYPTKMIVVGWNYAAHAGEAGASAPKSPMFYPLAAGSLAAHMEKLDYPDGLKRVDHEAELVAVMGKRAKNVPREKAKDYILGYSCGNDISARDFQWDEKDPNVARAKTVDGFSPVGPFLVTDIDAGDLTIKMTVNGKVRQQSSTRNMVFAIDELIEAVSRYLTLEPWDIIFTGTPEGISAVARGDVMEVMIDGIGTLCNTIA